MSDPESLLAKLRVLVSEYGIVADGCACEGCEMAAAFQEFDEHLSSGGAFPAEWWDAWHSKRPGRF